MSDGDCGAGYLYDVSASASFCEGAACDIAGEAADKIACCIAQATCGDADGEGVSSESVSDSDCGSGLLYDPSASTLLCEGATCDIDGVAADKTACCVAQASCGDSDGEGAGTASVTDDECGTGYIYAPSSSALLCVDTACNVAGVAADKAACCVEQATCGDTDGAGAGSVSYTHLTLPTKA